MQLTLKNHLSNETIQIEGNPLQVDAQLRMHFPGVLNDIQQGDVATEIAEISRLHNFFVSTDEGLPPAQTLTGIQYDQPIVPTVPTEGFAKSLTEWVTADSLTKMAIADIKPSTTKLFTKVGAPYDYSHVLEPEHREKGYQIRLSANRPWDDDNHYRLHSKLYHQGREVGKVKGVIGRDNDPGMEIDWSEVEPEHKGQGLGQKLYEALYSHAFHHLGIRTVYGANHSTSAHRAHSKLAEKHGMDYSARDLRPHDETVQPFDRKFGPYKYTIKSELEPSIQVNKELIHDMLGFNPHSHSAFDTARLMSGGIPLTLNQIRRALYDEDGDFEKAALRAYDIEPSEQNVKTLQDLSNIAKLGKSEEDSSVEALPATPEANNAAEAITNAFKAHAAQKVDLNGRYSRGAMVAKDPVTQKVYLLKPSSDGNSSAAGVKEESASQPRREAAFSHIAQSFGLGNDFPRADLVYIDGSEWAVIELLPYNYKSLDRLWKQDRASIYSLLERYRKRGTLHKWAILDYVLGNPDRHGQNMMVGTDVDHPDNEEIRLIDHGSAFAGQDFDPAYDRNSFIPFYLRYNSPEKFNGLSIKDKLKIMPRLPEQQARELSEWFGRITADKLRALLEYFGIDPAPSLARLAKIRVIGGPLDQVIDKVWVGSDLSKSEVITDLIKNDTPEFKLWFGNSKAVDKYGKPIVSYHGSPDLRWAKTGNGVFQTSRERLIAGNSPFVQAMGMTHDPDRAYYFTDSHQTARSYANDHRAWDYQNAEPGTIPVYLKMENPKIIDWAGKPWQGTREHIAAAKKAGHDSVIIHNVIDDYIQDKKSKPTTVRVVFHPHQIKSASGNKTFDGNDPDFRKEEIDSQVSTKVPPVQAPPKNVVSFKTNVGKLRLGRDHIQSKGVETLPFKDMPPGNWEAGRLRHNNHVSAQKLQEAIDTAPSQNWLYSEGKYGDDHRSKTCPDCEGTGEEVRGCPRCDGDHRLEPSRGFINNWIDDMVAPNNSEDQIRKDYKCHRCNGQKTLSRYANQVVTFRPGDGHHNYMMNCGTCKGTGVEIPSSDWPHCDNCEDGEIREPCYECNGNGEINQDDPDQDTLMGTQQHSAEPSSVWRLDLHDNHVNTLKNAGAWETFKKMYAASANSGHPINPNWEGGADRLRLGQSAMRGTPSLGWIRYTGTPHEGIHVDEVQSDFGQNWDKQVEREIAAKSNDNIHLLSEEDKQAAFRQAAQDLNINHHNPEQVEKAKARAKETLNERGLYETPEEITQAKELFRQKMLAKFEEMYPKAHRDLIDNLLFNKTHPNELVAEGFMQWLRGSNPNIMVHWPSEAFKAPISQLESGEANPAHFQFSYRKLPRDKWGMTPAVYGVLPTQETSFWQGMPMWQGTVRKTEPTK